MIVEACMQLTRLQNNEITCERETVSPPIYPVDRQKNQSHLYDIRIEQFSMRWCVPDVDLHLHHQWQNTRNLVGHMISIDEKPSVERNPGRPSPGEMWEKKLDLKSSALRDRNRETATKRARMRQTQGHKVLEGHRWVFFRAACSSASERKEKKHGSKLLMLQQGALWLPRGEREKDLETNLRLGFELRTRYLIGGKLFSSQKESTSNFVLLGGSILRRCWPWSFLLVLQKRIPCAFWLVGLLVLFQAEKKKEKEGRRMVLLLLQIKADLENVTNLEPKGGSDGSEFTFFFKVVVLFCFFPTISHIQEMHFQSFEEVVVKIVFPTGFKESEFMQTVFFITQKHNLSLTKD